MTVEMKSYIGLESGYDGDQQGVTAGISKCAECNSGDKILPQT